MRRPPSRRRTPASGRSPRPPNTAGGSETLPYNRRGFAAGVHSAGGSHTDPVGWGGGRRRGGPLRPPAIRLPDARPVGLRGVPLFGRARAPMPARHRVAGRPWLLLSQAQLLFCCRGRSQTGPPSRRRTPTVARPPRPGTPTAGGSETLPFVRAPYPDTLHAPQRQAPMPARGVGWFRRPSPRPC
jgi:hypothetical protein